MFVFLTISLIQANFAFASESFDTETWEDDTIISVSIVGDDVIDLDTSNRFIILCMLSNLLLELLFLKKKF